jgi:heme/copper-type cytochrome/quinol oxidase subunit 1
VPNEKQIGVILLCVGFILMMIGMSAFVDNMRTGGNTLDETNRQPVFYMTLVGGALMAFGVMIIGQYREPREPYKVEVTIK